MDIKLLAKILALHLNQVIISLIHLNQVGLMPNKNTAYNIQCVFMNLQAHHVGNRVLVALEVAKDVNSMEWNYLWECLCCFGIGPNFIKWLKLLYQEPVARVAVNGHISSNFRLFRVRCQVCPLSPLQYALAIKQLAIALHTHLEIHVVIITLYADDMLLFLEDLGSPYCVLLSRS